MALTAKMANAHVNAQADALNAQYNAGKLRIYDSTGGTGQPANADTAIGSQVKLAEFTLPSPCFGSSALGVVTASAIADVLAIATGTATWYRVVKSDGVTGLQDGSVGLSGCDLNIADTAVVTGVLQHINSWTHTVPKG